MSKDNFPTSACNKIVHLLLYRPSKAVDYIYDINVLNTNGHKAMCFCRPERKRESSYSKPNVKA